MAVSGIDSGIDGGAASDADSCAGLAQLANLRTVIYEQRRQRVAQRWAQLGWASSANSANSAGVVLIYSGAALPIAGTDQVHPFFPHPDFVHLTGHGAPRLVLAYAGPGGAGAENAEGAESGWQLFGYRSTPDEMVWEQPTQPLGLPLSELAAWLEQHGVGQPAASADQPTPDQTNPAQPAESPVTLLGAPPDRALATAIAPQIMQQISAQLLRTGRQPHFAELTAAIAEDRLIKDAAALDDFRQAANCSLAGFNWVFENATAGMTEREIQINMEAAFYKAGSARVAYDSIVAAGNNSAFLHYVPAATEALRPTSATINPGDLLLIDAGAQIGGYASDVTRTMVVGAEPTEVQEFLWRLVLQAQELAIDRCRPGNEWREVHLEAAHTIGSGLVELGLLKGAPSELVASGAVALFFPHGLGHLIGLSVHDAGGYASGREPSAHPQMRYLRTDRVLQAGMVTSVEPGVYFIDALLDDPQNWERFGTEVVWERVDELRGFGGIRIEDDVLITNGDPEVLSAAIAKPIRIG